MKANSILRLFIPAFLAIALSSCYPLVQKAYYVESPNVGAFDTTKQTNLNFSGQYFTHTNVQYSHSFNEHSGMFAGMHIGYQGWTKDIVHDSGLTNSFGLSTGYIWYKQTGKKYFEIATGYGFQTNTNLLRSRKIASGLYYEQNVDAIYHRLIVQPSYFWDFNGIKLGLTLRNEFLYMPHYDFYYETQTYGGSGFIQGVNSYSDYISFSDKMAITHQLFFVFRNTNHRIKWGLHAGVAFHSLYLSRPVDNPYLEVDVRGACPTAHPAMATYIIGCDFGLIQKKKH